MSLIIFIKERKKRKYLYLLTLKKYIFEMPKNAKKGNAKSIAKE